MEQAWIRGLKGKSEFHYRYKEYQSLKQVRELADQCNQEVTVFVQDWSAEMANLKLDDFTYDEVLHQIVRSERMIYKTSTDGLTSDRLMGFFVDWSNPPSTDVHFTLLKQSSHIVVAIDERNGCVVGFITAISDGVLSAYIPLLEVLPDYKGQGIGKELVQRMMQQLVDVYMIDLSCDDDLVPYYESFGMKRANGMYMRNYKNQSGKVD